MSGTQAKKDTIGIIGLGDMGANIAETLRRNGFPIAVCNRTPEKAKFFRDVENVHVAEDLKDLVSHVHSHSGNPIIWLMVAPDDPTREMVLKLSDHVKSGDIIIDGSNSIYTGSMDNHMLLSKLGVSYLDVGVAGGPYDVGNYVALMIGGDRNAFEAARPVFKALACKSSYDYVGPSGSGHFAKAVHNMVFYSIFPIYANALELLSRQTDVQLDPGTAMRLFAEAPPITDAIQRAMSTMLRGGHDNGEHLKEPGISKMVGHMQAQAKAKGINITAINAVLESYPGMSEESKKYYSAAKRIITGH